MKIVAIGDAHAHPDYDLKRFTAIGEFVAEQRPDVVVFIGDFADVVSLNSHGSKLELEGARWKDDIAVTKEALAAFMQPLYDRKKKLPRRVLTLGNHEERVNKWVKDNPKFAGTMKVNDLGFEAFGFEVFPYAQRVNIEGFRFTHNLMNKSGYAGALGGTGGVKALGVSTVVGHSHTAEHYINFNEDRRFHGINLGCLIHKDMGIGESWSNPTAYTYWRGVWVLDNVNNGDADISMIRAESIGA